ncbi:MAG: hypothetical protein ACRECO_15070 [Xanthobacteraceae bacterium]
MRHLLHDGIFARRARGCVVAFAALLTAGATAADPIDDNDVPLDFEQPLEQSFDFSTPLPAPASPAAPGAEAPKFKRKSAPTDWEAKLGVDNRPALKDAELRPERFLHGATQEPSEGVAWANVTGPGFIVTDKTTFETRLDPDQQSKLGMTLSRSIPLGSTLSMTWQNGYSVTQSHTGSPPTEPLTNPEPLAHTAATAPVSVMPGQPPASQVFDSNQVVRFTILPADTTVSLGAAISTANEKWMRSMSAEQKLFGGPVSVTGAVEETPTGELSKSLKAGFKRTW